METIVREKIGWKTFGNRARSSNLISLNNDKPASINPLLS